MHTAEQARERWCPMVRIAFNGPGPFNRLTPDTDGGPGIPRGSQCIANECAMWRWLPEPPAATVSIGIGLVTEELPRIPTERRGYCGLAPIHHTT